MTEFLNALFIQDEITLEPSEKEVKSIVLIISEAYFFQCFNSIPTWNFRFPPFFFKIFLHASNHSELNTV